jgi:hypothetical protein
MSISQPAEILTIYGNKNSPGKERSLALKVGEGGHDCPNGWGRERVRGNLFFFASLSLKFLTLAAKPGFFRHALSAKHP